MKLIKKTLLLVCAQLITVGACALLRTGGATAGYDQIQRTNQNQLDVLQSQGSSKVINLKKGAAEDNPSGYRNDQSFNSVFDALGYFNSSVHPLQFRYLAGLVEDVSYIATTLQTALVIQDLTKTITWNIAQRIHFQGSNLVPGELTFIGAVYHKKEVTIGILEDTVLNPVVEALDSFEIIYDPPITIPYVQNQNSSNPETTRVLRTILVRYDISKIITPKISTQISFIGWLYPKEISYIIAVYHQRGVWVPFQEKSKSTSIIDNLKKIDQHDRLKIKFVTDQHSSNQTTTAVLRTALTARDKSVFTKEVVKNITFNGILTAGGMAKTTAHYCGVSTNCFIQEANPLPRDVFKVLSRYTYKHPLFLGYEHASATTDRWVKDRMVKSIESKYITTKVVNKITLLNLEGIDSNVRYLLKIKYQGQRGSFWVLVAWL